MICGSFHVHKTFFCLFKSVIDVCASTHVNSRALINVNIVFSCIVKKTFKMKIMLQCKSLSTLDLVIEVCLYMYNKLLFFTNNKETHFMLFIHSKHIIIILSIACAYQIIASSKTKLAQSELGTLIVIEQYSR